MRQLLRRIVSVTVLSGMVIASAAPANASVRHGHRHQLARHGHSRVLPHHAVRPHAVPASPTNFVATPGDQQASFTFGGVAGATRYVVLLKPSNASCVTILTACAVRGLTNGTTYSASVVAVNADGMSAPSATRSVTPVAAAPTAPRFPAAVAFGLHARVTWTAVTGLSNAVTNYTATSSPGNLTCTTATTSCIISDLEAATTYTFTITATNAIGTSLPSLRTNAVTITDRPGAPTNIDLAPAPTSIGISWDVPASDGGLSIDAYVATVYLASSGAPVAHCRVSTTSCEVTGLQTATSYVVRVIAHNAEGYSASISTAGPVLTGYNVPGEPQAVAVTAAPETVTVSWSTPVSDGGGALTGYTATADDGNGGRFTCSTQLLTCTITGLTDGVTYTITVVATNGVGDSTSSTPRDATPGTVPDAPTDIAVTPGNGQASVSWLPPLFSGGSDVTGYTVTADDGNGGQFTCTTTTKLGCIVTGLTNGVSYTFTVTATNPTGESKSSTSTAATPKTNPSAPTITRVTPGDGTLSVSFTAPAANGGATVTQYTATANDGNGSLFTCTTSLGLTCTITGLTNGVNYAVTVVATNSIGDSNSSASTSASPYTAPSMPLTVSSVRGDRELTVSWTVPSSDGGDSIFRYTVTADDGDGGVFTCTTTTKLGCVVTGLTNGVSYTITVVATNNAGDSTPSSSITDSPAPLTSVPDRPTDVAATSGDSSLSVSWTAPAFDGGLAISGYTVTADDGDGGIFTCTTTTKLGCVVTGLTNGVSYTITVVATNNAGDSLASGSLSATPCTTPSEPSEVSSVIGDSSLTVSWTASTSDGGNAIVRYTVTADDGAGGTFTCSTDTTSCTVSGLTNGVQYTITVVATNGAGDSSPSTSSSAMPYTVPGVPQSVATVAGNGRLVVSWTAPSSDGGQAITGYTVSAYDDYDNYFTCTTTTTGCTLNGLTNGYNYYVYVVATNVAGSSKDSTSVSGVPFTTPGAPKDITATPGPGSVVITWSPSVSNGGSPITAYTVTAYDSSGSVAGSCSTEGLTYECTVWGLTNFVTYVFVVTATNEAGDSPTSMAPALQNPQTIIEWGNGWLAYDNWDGFVSSDPTTQDIMSSLNGAVTEDWDCNVQFMVAGPNGGIYLENACGDLFFVDASGDYSYIGYNTWGRGYQFTVGPNGELIFATDSDSLHLYDYTTGDWYVKYIYGAECIDGIVTDTNGTIWISDVCRGDIASVTDNMFDQLDGGAYSVDWQNLDMCSPWWLSTDSSGTIYIGNIGCQDGYNTFQPGVGSTYVSTPNANPRFVGGLAGTALPIDFNPWPHQFISTGVSAMPQSNEPTAPKDGSVFTWGDTWVQAMWNAPTYTGLGGAVQSYRLIATGPEGDVHSCVTSTQGITSYDSWSFTCTVLGLQSGVAYDVTVVATNLAGDGPSLFIETITTSLPSVSVPSDISQAVNFSTTTISSLSTSGASITVSDLPRNWMVTVWVANATLGINQYRETNSPYQAPYWGGQSLMMFSGDTWSVNYDLSHLTITPNVANATVTIYAVATPNNIIFNPVNGHYYQTTLSGRLTGTFAENLALASQQNLLGLQGYMATPNTAQQLDFLSGIATNNIQYGGSDDAEFILDPVTGLPLFSYLYANNDPSTAWTEQYQSDPNASFQKWYWVSGPLAGTQFANGGMLSGPNSGTDQTGVNVNGSTVQFCANEPNNWGMGETILMLGSYCLNDNSKDNGAFTFIEYGGFKGDTALGTAEVTGSTTFITSPPISTAPRDLVVTGDEVGGFSATWSEPSNANTVGVGYYSLAVFQQNDDGSETLVWSSNMSPWVRSSWLGGMSYPHTYRVALTTTNSYGTSPADSITFSPANVRPTLTVTSQTVTGNSIAMDFTVSSTYGTLWNYLYFYDVNETNLGNCFNWGNGSYHCDIRNLPANATIRYALTTYAEGIGWIEVGSNTFVTGDPLLPDDATGVTFDSQYWSTDVSWTVPTNNTAAYWKAEAWATDKNGNPYLAAAGYNYYSGATSLTIYGLNPLTKYKYVLYAVDSYSISSAGVKVSGSTGDPYVQISDAKLTINGNAVTGAWTTAESYGSMWYSRMEIYAMDGTYVATCQSFNGVGANTCWTGGLTLSTDYYALIQGYGWSTNWGGGVRVDFTTGPEYVAGNYHDIVPSSPWITSTAYATDGSVWYLYSSELHHVVAGVDSIVDVSSVLPANVSLRSVTALPSGGVAFSTNGYDNGWLDTGIVYIDSEGTIAYLADGATNCANQIVAFGPNSVVVSSFMGLTQINLTTGAAAPVAGFYVNEQMYATLVPSNDGMFYFLDRYDNTLLHRYDGVFDGRPVLTNIRVPGYNSSGAVLVNGVYYNYDNSSWNTYILQGTDIYSGISTAIVNFAGLFGTPSLVTFAANGTLVASSGSWIFQITTLPIYS